MKSGNNQCSRSVSVAGMKHAGKKELRAERFTQMPASAPSPSQQRKRRQELEAGSHITSAIRSREMSAGRPARLVSVSSFITVQGPLDRQGDHLQWPGPSHFNLHLRQSLIDMPPGWPDLDSCSVKTLSLSLSCMQVILGCARLTAKTGITIIKTQGRRS